MKYLYTYNNYIIKEGNNGISPLVLELTDKINKKSSSKIKKCENFEITIEKYDEKDNEQNFRINNLKVVFNYNEYKDNICNGICDTTNSSFNGNFLDGCIITLNIFYKEIDSNFIENIESVISHEVLHLYQNYNLLKNNKFKPESWSIGSILPSFRKTFKEKYTQYLINMIYISLSHEIYAQLQQYYYYRSKDKDYNKIFDIIKEMENFNIKSLNNIEDIEINFMKDYILKALLNGKRNKKWINDVNKSLWKETDNQKFLQKFKLLLDKKANLIKREIKKVDNNFDIDYLTNEAMSTWISLPTNFEIKDLPDNYKFQIELIDFL